MKTIRFLNVVVAVLLATVVLTSCGSKKEATLTVDKVKINGNSKEYIEVVPGSYELKAGERGLSIPIKFRTIKAYDPDNFEEMGLGNSGTSIGNMGLEVLDASGNPIDMGSNEISPSSTGDWNKVISLLTSKPGEEVTVNFSCEFISDDIMKNLLSEGKSFDIVSADITNPKNGESSSTDNDQSSSSTDQTSSADDQSSNSGSEDWDKVLTNYSNFVDQYIVLLKKAKAGDNSAVADYPDILQKAQDLSEKLQSAQGSLSSSQAAKFLAIENKLAQAAAQLEK